MTPDPLALLALLELTALRVSLAWLALLELTASLALRAQTESLVRRALLGRPVSLALLVPLVLMERWALRGLVRRTSRSLRRLLRTSR